MAIGHRLRRLERTIGPDQGGLRPCSTCRSGEDKRIVFLFEGEPMHGGTREALCPACGRDRAYLINLVKAETVQPRAPP